MDTKRKPLGALVAALALAACSPPERQAPEANLGTAQESPAPRTTDTLTSPAAADPHAGHTAPASGADHAGHAVPGAPARAGRDAHAGHEAPAAARPHTGAHAPAAAAAQHAHAEHNAPDAAPAPPPALASLVAALLEDPDVQRRIQQDAELREMWSDPAVRRQLAPETESSGAMQKVMLLVQGLLEDPQVQARIQADPELRALWADQNVRRRILEPRQP